MIVCDPCFKSREWKDRQLAIKRLRIHNINQDGNESFGIATIDVCPEHLDTLSSMLHITLKDNQNK